MTTVKNCLNCTGQFEAQKTTAQFCSGKCRVAYFRKQKKTAKIVTCNAKEKQPLETLSVTALAISPEQPLALPFINEPQEPSTTEEPIDIFAEMLLDDKRLSETAGKKQPQTETAEPDTQEISVKGSLAEYLLTLIFKRLLEASQQQLEANQKKTAPTYQATKEPWQPFVLPAEIEEPILPKQSWLSRIIKHLKNSLRLENLRII